VISHGERRTAVTATASDGSGGGWGGAVNSAVFCDWSVGDAEGIGFLYHASQHASYFRQVGYQSVPLLVIYVRTVAGRIDPMLSFLLLSVGVGQFADEMLLVPSFRPCLGDLCPYGPR